MSLNIQVHELQKQVDFANKKLDILEKVLDKMTNILSNLFSMDRYSWAMREQHIEELEDLSEKFKRGKE